MGQINNLKNTGITLDNYPSEAKQPVKAFLLTRGISEQGARQFLSGEAVSDASDRHQLAVSIGLLMDAKGGQKGILIGLLLPAVQNLAQSRQKLQKLGVSALGAYQFLAGQPVTNADDRQTLGLVVIAQFGDGSVRFGDGSVRKHSGGVN